jgi:hypothetical protein
MAWIIMAALIGLAILLSTALANAGSSPLGR